MLYMAYGKRRNTKRMYKKKQYTRKRKYYKRKYNTSKSKAITYINRSKSATIFPDRYLMQMEYNSELSLSNAADFETIEVFRGNSIFDPYYGTGGTTVNAYTRMYQIYKVSRVLASRIDIRLVSTTGSGTPSMVTIFPYNDSAPTFLASVNSLAGIPYSKETVVTGYGAPFSKLSNYISTKKMYGQQEIDQREDFSALSTQNPTTVWYWIIGARNLITSSTAITAIWAQVRITYYVEWYDRIDLQVPA